MLPEVAAVRPFNRFYTQRIGVLHRRLLSSPFSLSEARLLYELAHRERPSATDLATDLGLDPGYLSRIVKGFEEKGLVRREQSSDDARRAHLALTRHGREAFAALDHRSAEEVRE